METLVAILLGLVGILIGALKNSEKKRKIEALKAKLNHTQKLANKKQQAINALQLYIEQDEKIPKQIRDLNNAISIKDIDVMLSKITERDPDDKGSK